MLGGIIAGVVLGSTKFFNNRFKRLIGIYGAGERCCWICCWCQIRVAVAIACSCCYSVLTQSRWQLHHKPQRARTVAFFKCAARCCFPAALLIMFFLEYYDMLSGGALGALTTGLVTCYMWEHGKMRKLSIGPTNAFSADIERVLAVVSAWMTTDTDPVLQQPVCRSMLAPLNSVWWGSVIQQLALWLVLNACTLFIYVIAPCWYVPRSSGSLCCAVVPVDLELGDGTYAVCYYWLIYCVQAAAGRYHTKCCPGSVHR